MLVLMVRGLFTSLKFAYVQIPCISVSGHQMFHPFWNAVCRLERCGFKVLALTCDGLAANRRLFQLHGAQKDLTYKVLNPYASDDRFIFFFSDPPHLIKTTRNGWVNKCRHLWVSYEWIVYRIRVKFGGDKKLTVWRSDLEPPIIMSANYFNLGGGADHSSW